jgi:hypothetical protein
MTVVSRGERELELRLDSFPSRLQVKLEQRIRGLTEELQARIEAAAPVKTGLLRSEIKPSIYTGEGNNRVAGYVSVFAGDRKGEYAKAATLEYGSTKARKISARLSSSRRAIERHISRAPHIQAFRYLRGPFEQMRSEIEAALEETVAEVAAEDEAS